MGIPSQIKRYLVWMLVLVLILSIGLILYDHLVVLPQMQFTTNNIRVEAFKAWLYKMKMVKHFLKHAETNFEVRDVSYHTLGVKRLVDVFTSGIDIYKHPEKLYYWVDEATFYLHEALDTVYSGNQTGVITERNLDHNILTMIENVTITIENLDSKTIPLGQILLSPNGVDPAQQLREVGVLADVLNYLEQVYQVSIDIYNYYY